ncbi:MAG: hypothetical protein RLN89_04085 [Parvibaculum sp.]
MKMLDFSPRPGAAALTGETYRPGMDLAEFAFAEQFLVWATRAIHIGQARSEQPLCHLRLESAFAAIDAPDALPILQQFLGLLEIKFGRPLAAPCFKWRTLMADEARVLTLIAAFQTRGSTDALAVLPKQLQQAGQQLAICLHAAGLVLSPSKSPSPAGHSSGHWPEGMPLIH